jgi:hypothetical protein
MPEHLADEIKADPTRYVDGGEAVAKVVKFVEPDSRLDAMPPSRCVRTALSTAVV